MQRSVGRQQLHLRSERNGPGWERVAFILAFILILGGILGYIIDQRTRTVTEPVIGGTYTEGVLADSPTKVERIVTHLTNIGLTYRDSEGKIEPALAASWDISADNKTYTFHLKKGFSSAGLLTTIQNSKTNWSNITITAPSNDSLQFTLPEPLSLFLSSSTTPLFPYGPYEVAKREKDDVILRSNPDFVGGVPYIPKISIKSYTTSDALLSAAKGGEINGSADFADSAPKTFVSQTLDLPRYYILFLNMTRPAFKKIEDRKRVIDGTDGPPVTYTLLTSQTGPSSDLAGSLAQTLQAKHITLTVQKKEGVTLQKEDIAKREFDLLLYGVNYGVTRDYYPLWHSSQAGPGGLNITGVKDKDLDALLESARKEPDDQKREVINKQIEAYVQDKGMQKIMSQEKSHFWVDRSIQGMKYGTIEEANDRFNLIWQWYIKSHKVRPRK